MKPPLLIAAAALYALCAIVTFGHAWSNVSKQNEDRRFVSAAEMNTVESLGCAAFWPLYWSVQAWKTAN